MTGHPPGKRREAPGRGPLRVDIATDALMMPQPADELDRSFRRDRCSGNSGRGSDSPADPPFQVMPPLTDDEYAALRDDIAERGVLVPVVLDQHGRILDGHHRQRIAAELGIDCPKVVQICTGDEEAREVALTLNLARRHLTREQRRDLIAAEIEARPGDSDRAIARRFGCSPSTVGSVRHPEVSKLDTREERIRASLDAADADMAQWLRDGGDPAVLVDMLSEADRQMTAEHGEDFAGPVRRNIIEPRIHAVLGQVSNLDTRTEPEVVTDGILRLHARYAEDLERLAMSETIIEAGAPVPPEIAGLIEKMRARVAAYECLVLGIDDEEVDDDLDDEDDDLAELVTQAGGAT